VGLLGGLGIVVLLFVPLLAHELQTGFLETRGVLDYLRGGDTPSAGPLATLAFTLLRVVGWPLVGLVTDVPQLAAIMLAVVVGLAAWGLRMARGAQATGLRWLAGILAWSTLALAFAAPSLQRVVPGLPNDHYHAFLDPIVAILVAVPAADLFTRAVTAWRANRRPAGLVGAVAVAAGVALLVGVALARKPPLADPDGGWPALRDAGARIVAAANGAPVTLIGLPEFKLPDAIGFPIEHAGGRLVEVMDPRSGTDVIVVACDRLFEAAIGAACGGPAEDSIVDKLVVRVPGTTNDPRLIDRFDASPRTAVSIYAP
jgi:hypothetical protein